MTLPRLNNRFVLVLPWLLLGFGIWLVVQGGTEVRVQFERAEDFWRVGDHESAVELYRHIAEQYPNSAYAPRALWEIGTIEYINLYQVERASLTFNSIVEQYPQHPLSSKALERLAEISEVDFKDYEAAVERWKQLLTRPLQEAVRNDALFRLGNAWFHLSELNRAQSVFMSMLRSNNLSTYLRQQVNIRLGTISQLQHEYAAAIPYFEAALEPSDCGQCRLAGQLGLIESYEFMGELQTALSVAARIEEAVYSPTMKEDLLNRLQQKQRYFNPSWTGAR